jgi:hypothetical protein
VDKVYRNVRSRLEIALSALSDITQDTDKSLSSYDSDATACKNLVLQVILRAYFDYIEIINADPMATGWWYKYKRDPDQVIIDRTGRKYYPQREAIRANYRHKRKEIKRWFYAKNGPDDYETLYGWLFLIAEDPDELHEMILANIEKERDNPQGKKKFPSSKEINKSCKQYAQHRVRKA